MLMQHNATFVMFCLAEPNYPQNVLVVNGSGVHLVGADADLNYNLPMSAGPPLAVDTISRFVYWYHEPSNSIARHSLNSNRMDVYVSVKFNIAPQSTIQYIIM